MDHHTVNTGGYSAICRMVCRRILGLAYGLHRANIKTKVVSPYKVYERPKLMNIPGTARHFLHENVRFPHENVFFHKNIASRSISSLRRRWTLLPSFRSQGIVGPKHE
jgi:hypothetical protein